jgi:hypothetical protein
MHIRISRVTRNGRTHEYAQLVESYRRPDGVPAHRLIATLGAPGDPAVDNFRAALAATRAGKRVALVRQPPSREVRPPKPTANLRYLDLAVLLELWRQWGLHERLDELLPQGEATLRPSSVVAALVLQRCVDPGSKLYASRWLPRTALPELLDLEPEGFNNTRLHRVLEDLDSATRSLMAKLPKHYEQRDGAFASLFMDVTDTWFVGEGPSLAAHGKTKEGRFERKVGIVLLCNEHGLPLRWETIPGTQADKMAMSQMLRAVSGLSWASKAPLVCDRAMGNGATIREMLATDLHFVTALTVTEFDSFAPSLPHPPFAALDPRDDSSTKEDVAAAVRCAAAAGLTKVEDNRYVLELGVLEYAAADPAAAFVSDDEAATVRAMRLGRLLDEDVKSGRFASLAAAARVHGLTKRLASKYASLRALSEQQQRDVLDGKAVHCTLQGLLAVAAIEDPDERQKAFDSLIAVRAMRRASKLAPPIKTAHVAQQLPMRVRVAAYFNPEIFVHERLTARRQLAHIDAFVAQLRAKIAAAPGRYKASSVAVAIDRELRKLALLEVYAVSVSPSSEQGRGLDVRVTLDADEWARRRRYDGFTVLVAHPSLPQSAAELSALYRAKDAVEKDFRVIKSIVELRPVWHHTDAKLRAHVTLCMLALLLERTLHRSLQPLGITAEAALESLATCCLNHYAPAAGSGVYCITHIDPQQRAILKALRLLHLGDDDDLADKIHPRGGVVTTLDTKSPRKQARS